MEKKDKRVVNKKNTKAKSPNFYKGKNNTSSKIKNTKAKKNNSSKSTRKETVAKEKLVDEVEKFKFYENTMAINLDGYIEVNDDAVVDYGDEPILVEIKDENTSVDENYVEDTFVNPVDSVNAYDEAFVNDAVVVDDVIVDNEVKYEDIAPAVSEDDEITLTKDETDVIEEIVEDNTKNVDDTEVLELDEIKYSDNADDAIPEIENVELETKAIEDVKEEIIEEKKETVKNEVLAPSIVENNTSVTESKYYNFETRTILMIIISIISFIIAFIFIYQAINYTDIEDITYNENSIVNYSVCLNENDYYNGDCLGENMQYISSLTNNVPITFNYNITYSQEVDYNIEYYVLGKTLIYDRDDASKILYRDDKIITERTTVKGNSSLATVSAKVVVPFKDRNDYVNGYKSKYALNSLASYEVVLYADDGNGPREVASATIPLSTQTFNISEETVMNENASMTMKRSGLDSVNAIFAVLGVIFIGIGAVSLIKLVLLVYRTVYKTTNSYQKKLAQILSEYDRVIVISRSEYNIDPNKQFVKVDSFYELLDARDTLEKPIVYEKVNNIKSFFYVEDNDRVYRYAMKESDFEKK